MKRTYGGYHIRNDKLSIQFLDFAVSIISLVKTEAGCRLYSSSVMPISSFNTAKANEQTL